MVNAIQLAEHSDIHGSPAPAGQDRLAVQLQQAGVKGELTKLKQVAQDFDNDVLTLNLLAAYLNRWYAGRLNGLETIPLLLHSETTGQGLRRILAAFEAKLHGTSDITLLYLLMVRLI